MRDGYWRPEEEADVVAGIAATSPGHPVRGDRLARQGALPRAWKEAIGAGFVMGVGGSFDVYAGGVRRAPRWMRRIGLEWVYRVVQEPRRMWRRYVVDAPRFAWLVLKARARRRA